MSDAVAVAGEKDLRAGNAGGDTGAGDLANGNEDDELKALARSKTDIIFPESGEEDWDSSTRGLIGGFDPLITGGGGPDLGDTDSSDDC